jgi:hypothetical protein
MYDAAAAVWFASATMASSGVPVCRKNASQRQEAVNGARSGQSAVDTIEIGTGCGGTRKPR